jgi:hypothetical protein
MVANMELVRDSMLVMKEFLLALCLNYDFTHFLFVCWSNSTK